MVEAKSMMKLCEFQYLHQDSRMRWTWGQARWSRSRDWEWESDILKSGMEGNAYIYMTKRWWCTVKWILILGSADQTPGDYRFTLVFLALLYLKEIRKNREDETVISKPEIHDSKARASEVAPSAKKECEPQIFFFSNDWLWRSNSAFLEDCLLITLLNLSIILNYNCRIITNP